MDSRAVTALLVLTAVARVAVAGRAASVVAVDDEVRVRRADAPSALGRALPASGGEVSLVALRGETVAFQVVVVAGDSALARTSLQVEPLVGKGAPLPPTLFREHYRVVDRRSFERSEPAASLGWLSGARPPDREVLGEVPDALIPIDLDPLPVAPGPAVPPGQTGAFWVDVFVPDLTPSGDYAGVGEVRADGVLLCRFTLRVRVLPAALPYRATSVFIYYEADRLANHFGPVEGARVERQLWQLLHAHQIDAIGSLAGAAQAERLADAYDGDLFRAAAGYDGPGVGVSPAVVALGAYGVLGAPGPESLARRDAPLAPQPAGARAAADLFVYAADEQCRGPRAAEWRQALGARPAAARVAVGQTCDDPPARQAADIAMVSARAFARATTVEARAAGRRAWIYNGVLPRTGTLLLDADPRGLTANGWIAAAAAIERWFYWESIFWDDDNRGGRGPVDPFVTVESFHNYAGDTALGDGLLLYPGRQGGRFAARSLGFAGVLPSLRLKAIRRGIEDAGIIALAGRQRPEQAARLVAEALPAMLDEAAPDRRAAWETSPVRFSQARAALRDLISTADPMSAAEIRAVFEDLAARRRRALAPAPPPARWPARFRAHRARLFLGGALAVLFALGLAAARRRRVRRAARADPPS